MAGITTVFEGPVDKDGEPYGSIMGSMTTVGALGAGEPVTRSIVGGTGDYVGVDGEVTTVRNEDGSYTHTLSIIR